MMTLAEFLDPAPVPSDYADRFAWYGASIVSTVDAEVSDEFVEARLQRMATDTAWAACGRLLGGKAETAHWDCEDTECPANANGPHRHHAWKGLVELRHPRDAS